LTVITTVVIWVLVLDFNPQQQQQQPMGEGKVLTSSLNKKRKLFHALAVIMFVPGVLFEVSSRVDIFLYKRLIFHSFRFSN
jgi:hypothetical protein